MTKYINYSNNYKDKENNLGDHGVRKYDCQIGRFTSTEPLYEKYFVWSTYQYSLNNPDNFSDWNGLNAGALVAVPAYVGGAVTIAVIGWTYVELTNPGANQTLVNTIINSYEVAVNNLNELEASLNPPKENPATLNPMAQDATATNVNLMNAEQKLEKQVAKQDRKSPESQGKKPDGGNKEVLEVLKRSLTSSYGARKAAEILKDRSIQKKLHDFGMKFKEGQNISKDKIQEVIKEFRDIIGK